MALPETNLTLIARMKDPVDQRAWQEFVGAYEPFLLRMLIRRGFMDADARDLVQQVFLGVCRSLDQWNSDGIEGSFRRWLSGVTRNTVLKFLRTKGRQPLNIGGSDFLNQQLELPDSDVDVAKLQQEYDREIFLFVAEQVRREFREQSWQAFWKTAVEGQDVARVAIEQGVERGAIYMSRSRIMARIRSRIAELGEQEAL
jgi:RNA polymerase sigma-70 factor (ECF subfamily)